MLLQLYNDLGIVVNHKRSNLEPSSRSTYFRMIIDTEVVRVFPTKLRVENILMLGMKFFSVLKPSVSMWQCLLGHMTLLEKLVLGGCFENRDAFFPVVPSGRLESEGGSFHTEGTLVTGGKRRHDLVVGRGTPLGGVPLNSSFPNLLLFLDASQLG